MRESIVGFVIFIIFVFAGYGYGSNIYKLVHCDFETPLKCEFVHGIGLFPIVGIFTGYMDIPDGEKRK